MGKIILGQQTLIAKKVVYLGRGQNQETTEMRDYSAKEWSHFVDWVSSVP